ncbi:MAG: threonylcarbamoyl-AMP synthase [Gammaproteobacteria bacterium]|nr:threonylcarbamoyl-AMP synthase [Gammaproteobacteria bacterium]
MITSRDLTAAVARLRAGEAIAFPTETVYGLGVDATNPAAVAKIFELKGRPSNHPLIVHLASASALDQWAATVPATAHRLAARFWPGPLTIILPRAAHVLDAVTGAQTTVGLRCPAHDSALALLQACAADGITGLAAPSANRFGRVSPTTAAHVRAEFGPALMILDGGPCSIGIESTIVDLSGSAPRILRPGAISEAAVTETLGIPLQQSMTDAPRVSGALATHYAPNTPLLLVDSQTLRKQVQALRAADLRFVVLGFGETADDLPELVAMPPAAAAYAQRLYAALREADESRVDRIIVEQPPQTEEWRAVHDRLSRAAGSNQDSRRR